MMNEEFALWVRGDRYKQVNESIKKLNGGGAKGYSLTWCIRQGSLKNQNRCINNICCKKLAHKNMEAEKSQDCNWQAGEPQHRWYSSSQSPKA